MRLFCRYVIISTLINTHAQTANSVHQAFSSPNFRRRWYEASHLPCTLHVFTCTHTLLMHTPPTQTHHTHMPHSLTFSDYHTRHSVVQCETLQLQRLAPVYPVSHECPQYSMLLLAWYSLSPGRVQTSRGVRSQAYCQSWWWGGLVWGEWTPRGGLGVCAGLQAMQYTQ